jgi:hypothetical protein
VFASNAVLAAMIISTDAMRIHAILPPLRKNLNKPIRLTIQVGVPSSKLDLDVSAL